MKTKTLTMEVKSVVPWGNGYAVYITKEAKKLGWWRNTEVMVYITEDQQDQSVVIKKAPIEQ